MFSDGDVLLGRYTIVKHLTTGQIHDFWLARDTVLKRAVLIRARPLQIFGKVFLDEARSLANLEHPHLLPMYDFGEHQGLAFVVVRYIEGGALDDSIKKSTLSIREIVSLAGRLASAIDFLHDQNVIHGDIKPRNILLGRQLHPYISNLFVSSVRKAIAAGSILGHAGSPDYEAPESFEKPGLMSTMDIYSFGITLYQCLTGVIPSHQNQPFGKAQLDGLIETLPSVRDTRPELPIGVDVVLQRLTRKQPNERYSNATEAADALSKAFYSGQKSIEGKVFISYSRKDKEFVYQLDQELRQIGLDTWIDRNDIRPGLNWANSIEKALNTCPMMLLITTKDSMFSEYVTHEWSYFMGAKKPVYPFIPYGLIPENIHPRLKNVQHILGSDDMLSDIARIVDVLADSTLTSL